MSWVINWQIISGPDGARSDDGRNQVWVGETVRFTLSPNPTMPNSVAMTEDAQRSRNWVRLPQLTVRGYQGTTVNVTANAATPVQIDYQFRWEGPKQLTFTGTPREVTLPTAAPTRRASTTTLFPPIESAMELQVVPPPLSRGRDAASMAGASSPSYVRGERELERERERSHEVERAREREQQRDRDARERDAAAARDAALAGAGPRTERELRNGLLNFQMRSEPAILSMSIAQLEDYLLNLQAAVAVTPPLDLTVSGWRSSGGQGPLSGEQYSYHWITERRTNGQIAFIKERIYRDISPQTTPRGVRFIPARPPVRVRVVVFPENAWIVAQVPGRGEKAILPVSELASQLEAERWDRLFGSLLTVALLIGEAALNPGAAVVELLLDMYLPPEIMMAASAASIVRGIASGLRRVIASGFRRFARRSAGSVIDASEDVVSSGRRAASEVFEESADAARRGSRGTPAYSTSGRGTGGGGSGGSGGRGGGGSDAGGRGRGGSDGGDGRSRRVRGGRHSRYRGPAQPVIGSMTRRSGEVGPSTLGELEAADAFSRTGHRVDLLPEDEAGWRQLVREEGQSRASVQRLRDQLRRAQRLDNLRETANPEFLVNGRVWDVLAPSGRGFTLNDQALDSIIAGIASKGNSRQTRRVAYVMNGYSESLSEIRSRIRTQVAGHTYPFGRNIDEVVFIQNGILMEIFSRGRGISP